MATRNVLERFKEWVLERSLWQVAVVYLLSTWALLGHIDLLTDRFGIADWLFNASLLVALLGLVVILFSAGALKRNVPLRRLVWVGVGYWVLGWIFVEGASALLSQRGLITAARVVILATMGLLPVALLVALFWPAKSSPKG